MEERILHPVSPHQLDHDVAAAGLVPYPNGNEKMNGNGHISLSLAMSDKNPRTPGWEVNVTYTFFVFNHVHDNYLVIPDGRIRRFHRLNTEYGFPQLLPLSTFATPSTGYLVDDCCAFGVELLVIKASGKGETFSIVKEPRNGSCLFFPKEIKGPREAYHSIWFYIAVPVLMLGGKYMLNLSCQSRIKLLEKVTMSLQDFDSSIVMCSQCLGE
ncbi:hypothetical protein CRYUN_Cryun07bG0090900 [Craigia yunnanensis]